ncbi:MAG: dethiobiotin synthase [Gammaproteobacteria bacterium]
MHGTAQRRGLFVTGTDTGVGKTLVATGIMTCYRQGGHSVLGMKPVACGAVMTKQGLRNQDALQLQSAGSWRVPYERVNPYCYAPPVAPYIAATEQGVEIALSTIVAAQRWLVRRADRLVVEGVGGWRVPLSKTLDVATLAARLGYPVVLVVGLRLGCINHALLTAEAIIGDGLALHGWIASQVDRDYAESEATLALLSERVKAPALGFLPWSSSPQPAWVADRLSCESTNDV